MAQHNPGAPAPLTAEQQKLVAENTGLVGLHLKRRVHSLDLPSRERERADLFQEGCLGLMEAARRWDPASGIPFGAFALLRIRRAVAAALRTGFSEPGARVRRPRRRRDPAGEDGRRSDERRRHDPAGPRMHQLPRDAGASLVDRRQAPGDESGQMPGERLRELIESAARQAASDYLARRSDVAGLDAVVQRVLEERLLVPDEERRRPLRRIAAETGATFARVENCERALCRMIRSRLASEDLSR